MFFATTRWKTLRKSLPQPGGKHIVVRLHENTFACMLESLCVFFFSPLLFEPQKSQILGLFYWAVSRHWTKRVGHFYPGGSGIAGELAKSKPELRKEGAGRRLGLGGWVWGLGQELAPERIITFNIGKMGAVLVEEAGGKGLQGSMGQLGRPSVDEGSCHRVLEEAGCLSGSRVCEELDKPGGFFAPSSSCFYAKDDEATSSAAHEFGVCYAP